MGAFYSEPAHADVEIVRFATAAKGALADVIGTLESVPQRIGAVLDDHPIVQAKPTLEALIASATPKEGSVAFSNAEFDNRNLGQCTVDQVARRGLLATQRVEKMREELENAFNAFQLALANEAIVKAKLAEMKQSAEMNKKVAQEAHKQKIIQLKANQKARRIRRLRVTKADMMLGVVPTRVDLVAMNRDSMDVDDDEAEEDIWNQGD